MAVALTSPAFLLAGCASAPDTNNVSANVQLPPRAPETPTDAAHRLVLARLDARDGIGFSDEQVYASVGAPVVCGRYTQAGNAPLRYIVVGAQDVFVEGDYRGDIGEAVAETCRNN